MFYFFIEHFKHVFLPIAPIAPSEDLVLNLRFVVSDTFLKEIFSVSVLGIKPMETLHVMLWCTHTVNLTL